ncbi:MAG TPA: sn-glycerol-3-phosphate ABC transporter ATP-binding protein UgpC [Alphaproteobacteria bacterium]|nr:sn-glycerol-3-phosphate ABC transporter ATP-binding protein UgpC [Alphaproteobacteria bacterium]
MATVDMSQVRKAYRAVPVIHGIDASFADGEFVVIVGPSGCGKSTLLRMIAGLEAISDGEISIGGRVVNKLEPKKRNVAMVFQNYALYPHMSVFDNMAYALKLAGVRKSEIRDRVDKTARILGLEDYLKRRPSQLSGGQRQRVAMGRAIVREPSVFLFDEPLSNLDAQLRVQMRFEIKQLHRELRATSVFVTHDQVEAMTMADRLVVMNAGLIEQIGSPAKVYNDPATIFVAGFIGSPPMNFVRGELAADGSTTIVTLANGRTIGLRGEKVRRRTGRVIVGMRPEHLRPAAPDEASQVEGSVLLVEELGASRLVHIETPLGRLIANAPVEMAAAPPVGAQARFKIETEHLHLFDPAEGRSLQVSDFDVSQYPRPDIAA